MTDFLIGFLLSMGVGIVATKKESLDETGLIAALILGTLVYGFVGWFVFMVLMVFFISSSLISKFNPNKKSSKRTMVQVIANGGVLFILVVIYAFDPQEYYIALMLTSIAIATSDTWSSEIGRLSKKLPRHILTFKPMKIGLSGGVSFLGFIAAIAGSLLIALLGWIVIDQLLWVVLIFTFGFLGGIIDSLLGTIQVKYIDKQGDTIEHKIYDSKRMSGLPFLTNDLVNFLANGVGVLLLWWLLRIV